ncbi:TIGR02117 family protein [Aestuariibius sp. HNIBRBA575]|uniref:TIGR02117 family protein n=1 Tax=Aestuariibius sp. HNIBRBA575 TaxID=3233343 RepID=UPI0034A4BF20
MVGLFGPIALFLIAGTVGGLIRAGETSVAIDPAYEIVLIKGAIHTDIAIPSNAQTRAFFTFADRAGVPISHPNADWILVGWGSQAFYTSAGTYADVKPSAVWRAVTGDSAVLRITVSGPIPNGTFTQIPVTQDQLDRLLDRIRSDLDQVTADRQGATWPGFHQHDRFFAAAGRFNLWRTCNVWVGDVLDEIGVSTGIWTPFTWTLP